MSPLYYKQIINILSAAITKSTITKEIQEIISVSQNTVENTALLFFNQSVVSKTDQCDQCDSVTGEKLNKKLLVTTGFLIVLIGSL